MTFKKWLAKQLKSGRMLDEVETDFAEDVINDKTFTEPKSLDELTGYLRHRKACHEAIEVAAQMYGVWQATDPKARMDGLSPKDIDRLRRVTREVWGWSYPRKLVLERCADKHGFLWCEKCKERTPKIQVDHIEAVGKLDGGYFERLFCPSTKLQGLCKSCHDLKTWCEHPSRKKKPQFCD